MTEAERRELTRIVERPGEYGDPQMWPVRLALRDGGWIEMPDERWVPTEAGRALHAEFDYSFWQHFHAQH